ncbi:phage tail protein [Castellaniella sp.]|uniref:phage tail protein n=1 Tax=Castellaniella sp. TaxID=1955812 RepID=UPI002AFE39E8|nr:phage tail protein [Castellaniella sp.]
MATQVFPGRPNLGAPQKKKPRINSVRFGDGYELRSQDGINASPATWAVTFTGNWAEHQPRIAVLEACGGVQYFRWTDPRGRTANFICREWEDRQVEFGVYEITAEFEEVFDL